MVDYHDVLVLGTRVAISDTARDLGVVIDREQPMSPCTALCRSGYSQLHQLWPVVRSLSVNATKTLVQTFISCHLDFCNSLLFGIGDELLRRLQSVQNAAARWSQAPVSVTTSHQCYGSCTGCQSVSALCSRSRRSDISRLLEWLPRTSQTTVAFCRTLVVAHCNPTPMTCGSCLSREHTTNSVIVIGVSRPPVLDCGMTFHLDYGGCDLPSTPSDNLWKLIYLATEALSTSFECIGAI